MHPLAELRARACCVLVSAALVNCGGKTDSTSQLNHVGGQKVNYGEVVAIGSAYSPRHTCTATRISPNQFLTASHCVMGLMQIAEEAGVILESSPSPAYWTGQKFHVWRGEDMETANKYTYTIRKAIPYQYRALPAQALGSPEVKFGDVTIVTVDELHQTEEANMIQENVDLEELVTHPESVGQYRVLTGGTGLPFLPWSVDQETVQKYQPSRWDLKYGEADITEFGPTTFSMRTPLKASAKLVQKANDQFLEFRIKHPEEKDLESLFKRFIEDIKQGLSNYPITEEDLEGHSITSGDSGAPVFLEEIATKKRTLIGVNSFIFPVYSFDTGTESVNVSIAQSAMRLDKELGTWVRNLKNKEVPATEKAVYTCKVAGEEGSKLSNLEFTIGVANKEVFLPQHLRGGLFKSALRGFFGLRDSEGNAVSNEELSQFPRMFETDPEIAISFHSNLNKSKEGGEEIKTQIGVDVSKDMLYYIGFSEDLSHMISIIPTLGGIVVRAEKREIEIVEDRIIISPFVLAAERESYLVPYGSCVVND